MNEYITKEAETSPYIICITLTVVHCITQSIKGTTLLNKDYFNNEITSLPNALKGLQIV